MKSSRVRALSHKHAVKTALLGALLSAGCAGFGGGGAPCAEYQDQPYQVEVCDQRSDTGVCSARHWEQRSRSVCVRREASAALAEPRDENFATTT